MQLRTACLPEKCLVAIATLFTVSSFALSEVQAGGKNPSNAFTIKGEYDSRAGGANYSATGAIEDSGWYAITEDDRFVDVNGEWVRYRFVGSQGTFYVGWLPASFEPGIEYPINVMPGTDAYANIEGVGTLKWRVRTVYEWITIGWGERYKLPVYSVSDVTVKGTLLSSSP